MLRIASEPDQRRTFEWVDERLGNLEEAAPLELAKAEEEEKDPALYLSKSKAEEKEEEAHHRLEATKELAHPLVHPLKEEAVEGFGVSIGESGGL